MFLKICQICVHFCIRYILKAIRKGAEQRPQCTGQWFKMSFDNLIISSCALGAAYEGLMGTTKYTESSAKEFNKEFPALNNMFVQSSSVTKYFGHSDSGSQRAVSLNTRIGVLNDQENWTRERIADWLEQEYNL